MQKETSILRNTKYTEKNFNSFINFYGKLNNFFYKIIRLSKEAADVIKGFYLALRENSSSASSIPITTR